MQDIETRKKSRLIIIFSRPPILGSVKKRLARVIGKQHALMVHKKLFIATMELVKRTEINYKLYLSDKYQLPFPFPYLIQEGSNLGDRMSRAMLQELKNYDHVCLIGSDCLDLNTEDLAMAFEMLINNDLVLGPAADGGYYLIGMKRPVPELFENISWGSDKVLEETVKVANTHKLRIYMLNQRSDVDRVEDIPKDWLDE